MSKLYVDEIVPRDTTSTNKIDLSGNSVSFTNLASTQTFTDITTTTLNTTSISSGTIGGNVVFPQGSIINVSHAQNSTRTVIPGYLSAPHIYWNAGNITKKSADSFLIIQCLLIFWQPVAHGWADKVGPMVRVGGGNGTVHYDGVTIIRNDGSTEKLTMLKGNVYHYLANQVGSVQIEIGQHPSNNANDRRIGGVLNPSGTDYQGLRQHTSDLFVYEVMKS